MDSAVVTRLASRRPRMAMLDAPACAKESTVAAPIPDPPPVMTIVFPVAERAGLSEEMDG